MNIDTQVPINNRPSGLGHFNDSIRYEALDYPMLWKCINAMKLKSNDVAIEIGCGRGRTLCAMARQRLKKVVGIELDEALTQSARGNIRRMRGSRSPVEAICADAAFYDFSEGTAFYMFHPFGAATMRTVLSRIHESLQKSPRSIRLVYVNPVHEAVLEEMPWLQRTGTVQSKLFRMRASLWEGGLAARRVDSRQEQQTAGESA